VAFATVWTADVDGWPELEFVPEGPLMAPGLADEQAAVASRRTPAAPGETGLNPGSLGCSDLYVRPVLNTCWQWRVNGKLGGQWKGKGNWRSAGHVYDAYLSRL
jgi:hypothetical protein